MKRTRRLGESYEIGDDSLPTIPYDIVIEILTRLPAKSLMRFKSVSKLWSSLICSQYFTTNRFITSCATCLYICLSFVENSHLKNLLLSASPSTQSDITFISGGQPLNIRGLKGYISHVFRGLMCLVNGSHVRICNTTTRQLVVLPDIEGSNIIVDDGYLDKKIMYHIGHDPVHNQYRVVCMASRTTDIVNEYMSENWVLVLGGDRSSRWRKIPCQSSYLHLSEVLTLNGHMHYLSWSRFFVSVIVSVDVSSEEISVVKAPEDNFCGITTSLIEYGGKLAILHYSDLERLGIMKLWVMEDAEKKIWSSKNLVLHFSQIHKIRLWVQGTTRNGDVILAPRNTNLFYFFLYNIQKNLLRKVEIKDTPNPSLTKSCNFSGLDDVENLIYL